MHSDHSELRFLLMMSALIFVGTASSAFTKGMSSVIFLKVDHLGFIVIILLLAAATIASKAFLGGTSIRANDIKIPKLSVAWVAAVAATACVLGTVIIYHKFPFSMDEFMTKLQGEIFLAGRIRGEVPEELRQFGRAMYHSFATYDKATGYVVSGYRPGMAAIYAIFESVKLGPFVSSAAVGGSVLAIYGIARTLWPDDREPAVVAAILIASSQQVLAAGMTSYAMSMHLCLNLLWLWLFLRGSLACHLLAPIIGVATASLHQVHLHILFALPFILFLLPQKKLRFYYGAIYVAGHFVIMEWNAIVHPGVASGSGGAAHFSSAALSLASIPSLADLLSVSANCARFASWQNLGMLFLCFMLARHRRLTAMERMLVLSIMLSLLPYPFLMPDQGHGWGYRYLHGLIGNVALLAAAGWVSISKASGCDRARWRSFSILLIVGSMLVMLPLRAIQIEAFVSPYAAAARYLKTINADVVVVDVPRIFYGQDFIRNDGFARQRPVFMDLRALTTEGINELCQRYSVRIVSQPELHSFGFDPREPSMQLSTPDQFEALRVVLASPKCSANRGS